MQQSCYDMYGITVEKSILTRMKSEMDDEEDDEEPMELIHHGISSQRISPSSLLDHHHHQACSGDEDGNSSENQNRSPSTSCENSIMEEPKAKKRRKQSNPSRYQTTPVLPSIESEDCSVVTSAKMGEDPKTNEVLDLHTDRESKSQEPDHRYRCHHCSSLFNTEDLLRIHVEEEHVQKILERQLQQQSFNKSSTSGNHNICSREGSSEPSKDSNCSNSNSSIMNNNGKPVNDSMALAVITSEHLRSSPPDNMQIHDHREFKNLHFPFPPMPPPFIPFSRSDDLKQGNLSVPLSMFPNPMAPFLFPVIPQGQTPPTTNGNSHSAHGVRIFNLEAYCELCNKEFCNKYFLKTHKANKHGIYSAENMSTPYGSPFLSPGLSSPIPLPHLLQQQQQPNSEPLPPSRTGLINVESYCEICQKEFCNKYFLKKHKQKIHGIIEPGQNISPSSTPSADATSNSPVIATAAVSLTTAPTGQPEKIIFHDEGRDIPISKMEFPSLFNLQNHKLLPATTAPTLTCPPTSNIPVTSISTLTDASSPIQHQICSNDGMVPHVFTAEKLREMGVINADAFCELCCKEFCNKYFLRTHKQNKHGINMPDISPGKPPSISGGSNSQPCMQVSQSQGSSNDKHESFPHDSQFSPGKYIQCSSPGMLTFDGFGGDLSCESCTRPFSSLYLLKMHKFYSHNIPYVKEESKSKPCSPTNGSNGNENKENEFVKPHLPLPPPSMLNENVSTSLQEDVASQDLQKLQSMIRELNASAGSESSKISCNLCRLEFDNKYFLRAHMMNEHGVLPNEDGHAPCHNNTELFSVHSKISEGLTDFPKLNFSSTGDSEAYCEICQKEFCSKYFLKTHKQNIHGIPLDMTFSQKKPSLMDEVSQIKTIVNNTISTVLPAVSAPSSSIATIPPTNLTTSPICVASTTSSPTVISSHNSIITSAHHTTSNSLLPVFSSQPPVSCTYTSALVPFCPETLPNSSNITSAITHTSNVIFSSSMHSTANVLPPVNISQTTNSLHVPTTSLVSSITHLPSSAHLSNIHHHSPSHLLSPLDKPRNFTGRNYCNICNKELCNKYFMKTHMLKMHGINLDSQPHEAARISTIGGVQCDICQKELCSKYFLKVHKQNTHGIFEEAPQIKDPTRESTEKDSPQLQGLDLSDPSGRYFSHYPEICPICNCRFKSIKWLKAHMVSDHSNVLKENLTHNSLQDGNSVIDNNCICVLCGQGFGDKVALHVHLIKDHQPPTEELGAASHSGIKTPSSTADSSALVVPEQARVNGNSSPVSATLPANQPKHSLHHPHHHLHHHHHHHPKAHGVGGSRIYHCSFCVYSTRWLSNLYAHEKRHTGVNTEGEKKFVCRVCHRAYRYNHSLQRHFLSHRAAGINMKELSQPLIVSTSNLHPLHHQHLGHTISRPWSSTHNKSDDKLSSQQSSHKIKRYRCSKCSKKFRSREMCLAHIHNIHNSGKKGVGSVLQKSIKPFRCRFCGFATRVWNVLKIHINKQHHNDMEMPRLMLGDDEKVTRSSPPSPQESPVMPNEELPPPPPNSPHLPMTFAMPQNPPNAGSFIMQPFLLSLPENDSGATSRNGTFVPSLVYLPVCQKVAQPMTVAFSLTPA